MRGSEIGADASISSSGHVESDGAFDQLKYYAITGILARSGNVWIGVSPANRKYSESIVIASFSRKAIVLQWKNLAALAKMLAHLPSRVCYELDKTDTAFYCVLPQNIRVLDTVTCDSRVPSRCSGVDWRPSLHRFCQKANWNSRIYWCSVTPSDIARFFTEGWPVLLKHHSLSSS